MKTSRFHESHNAEFVLNDIFSSQIGMELSIKAPNSIAFLMRKPKRFINEQNEVQNYCLAPYYKLVNVNISDCKHFKYTKTYLLRMRKTVYQD